MPWCQEAKKGVVSCDKLRVGASNLLSGDTRMGQPNWSELQLSYTEYIGIRGHTGGTETS